LAERLGAIAPVHLLGSPEAVLRAPEESTTETYGSTDDLMVRMRAWVDRHPSGVVVHAAAVGDYSVDPADPVADSKIPSGQAELRIRLVPTPKILDQIKGWSSTVCLVSFKAADPKVVGAELQELAEAQRVRTSSDLVFANTIGNLDADLLMIDPNDAVWFVDRGSALDALVARIRSFCQN